MLYFYKRVEGMYVELKIKQSIALLILFTVHYCNNTPEDNFKTINGSITITCVL